MDTAADSKTVASTDMVSSGQIVAKMLKQEGIKHIFRWPGSAVNWEKIRPVYLPR